MHFIKAKGILSAENRMNVYRGCSHGCIYCDSRSDCYQMKHPFEDIEVKENAHLLLEYALKRKRKKCMIGTGAMSDPYMHCEKEIEITKKCLDVIDRYSFGVSILTKSDLIERDIDLFRSINEKAKAVVQMTLTTADEKLCGIIEPNVSSTYKRYMTLKKMKDNNIPTVVWFSPILPFINDTEKNLRTILEYCFDADVKGIICFSFGTTMRNGSREYFYSKLDEHFYGIKDMYIKKYGFSYECKSEKNKDFMRIFQSECDKYGIMYKVDEIFNYLQEFPESNFRQMTLF